jgi:hypothetical protein
LMCREPNELKILKPFFFTKIVSIVEAGMSRESVVFRTDKNGNFRRTNIISASILPRGGCCPTCCTWRAVLPSLVCCNQYCMLGERTYPGDRHWKVPEQFHRV